MTTAPRQPAAKLFLRQHDILRKFREVNIEMLGCLACRWNASEDTDGAARAYGYQISLCRQIQTGSLYPMINRLETAGLVTVEYKALSADVDKGRPPRRYLLPAESELGLEFRQSLIAPEQCEAERNPE